MADPTMALVSANEPNSKLIVGAHLQYEPSPWNSAEKTLGLVTKTSSI